MNRKLLLACALTAAAALSAGAQDVRVFRSEPGGAARAFSYGFGEEDYDRAVIGITTSSGSARDTLGVLIGSIQAGGPAEKAGLEEGTRIAAINGVNLRLAAADVGDWDMSGIMSRRFTREMAKVKAGDEVDLRVYSGGQFRNVKIKTVAYEDLYRASRARTTTRLDDEDRPVIGVQLGSSGSKRDTLGVLITWLNDDGPAAKAGLEEGNRIQAIGNVDLRVARDDAGDAMLASVKVSRLQRELAKLRPGDEVDLRVYSDGRVRTVKLKTVSAYDLNRESRRRTGSIIINGVPRAMTVPTPPALPAVVGGVRRITM
jgi:predicted metalloprotease with PDZ domain